MYFSNYDREYVVLRESTSRAIELRASGEVFVTDESILTEQLRSGVVSSYLNAAGGLNGVSLAFKSDKSTPDHSCTRRIDSSATNTSPAARSLIGRLVDSSRTTYSLE